MDDSKMAMLAITLLAIVAMVYPGANDVAMQGITAVGSLAAGRAWGKTDAKPEN